MQRKILVDALGTLKILESFLCKSKMRQKIGLHQVPIQVKGLEFEVGNKCLLRQLTGLLIRQRCEAC
jgi:hypothetical protein